MDLGLKDKVIIVAGNAGGFGDSIVKTLSDENAIPILLENIYEPFSVKQAVKNITDLYGRIDGLVNNSAMNEKAIPETGFNPRFMQSIHENLLHYFMMTNAALPYLKISKGAIVNISCHADLKAQGDRTAIYAVTNGGLNALTREWAVDLLKYGIRVNSLIPNEYQYTPNKTGSTTLENTVAFLLSEKSSHTTGQLIHVNAELLPSEHHSTALKSK